ncbi:MAG: hypothetical protein AAGB26_04925 [Planctomycetota bacterium]
MLRTIDLRTFFTALILLAAASAASSASAHLEEGGSDHHAGSAIAAPTSYQGQVSDHQPPVTATRIDGQPDTEGLDPLVQESIRFHNRDKKIVPMTSVGFGMHPSLIRVPDWVPASERPHPSAKYYLYSAGHSGKSIHMAWSDSLTGKWQRWNPLGSDEHDGRAWGVEGNNTGAQTRGRGVVDLDIGPVAPPVTEPNGRTVNPGHYIDLGDVELEGHISSPEVIVDHHNKRFILWMHGHYRSEFNPGQVGRGRYHSTVVGTSKYGLNFNIEEDGGEPGYGLRDLVITGTYTRFLQIDAIIDGEKILQTIGVDRSGILYMAPLYTDAGENATLANADEPGGLFMPGKEYVNTGGRYWTMLRDAEGQLVRPHAGAKRHPDVIPPDDPKLIRGGGRHVDIWYDPENDRDTIYYFYTSTGDRPEAVLMTRVSLAGLSEEDRIDPMKWKRIDDQEHLILKPELVWEGAQKPLKTSVSGAKSQGNFMRSPHVFYDGDSGKLYFLYNGDGESKIGLAELSIRTAPRGD